ncbi:unnamed protein product [Orchesella dallaii]|uniref:Uncharacterized protein n=1 Tax=Orchesella dallaii TaxID=48710 RepID=A0ABP1RJI2_9HEXA
MVPQLRTNIRWQMNFILCNPIKLSQGLYEVGIIEIFYTPCNKIFGYEYDDNVIEIQAEEEKYVHCSVTKGIHLAVDITAFNLFNQNNNIPIQALLTTLNEKIHYEVVSEYLRETSFIVGDDFRNVFGFENHTYAQKRVLSEQSVNMDAYNELETGASITLDVITPAHIVRLTLQEPDEQTVDDLISCINEELINHKLNDI